MKENCQDLAHGHVWVEDPWGQRFSDDVLTIQIMISFSQKLCLLKKELESIPTEAKDGVTGNRADQSPSPVMSHTETRGTVSFSI